MAFELDHTHRCSQRGRRGSGLEGLAPPRGQLTRCFSAVAELLVNYDTGTYLTILAFLPSVSALIVWLFMDLMIRMFVVICHCALYHQHFLASLLVTEQKQNVV